MYALYAYKPGSSKANILSDIIKILTGTTNLSGLSSDCDTVASEISAIYDSAGWSIHDAGLGTDKVCIKAPCVDGITFKYLVVDLTTNFNLLGYETWDAATHTGMYGIYLNKLGTADISTDYFSPSTGGYIMVYSSARELALNFKTSSQWYNTASSVGIVVSEFTRLSTNMSVDRGYPSWIMSFVSNSGFFRSPRLKNPGGPGDATGSNAKVTVALLSPLINFGYKRPNTLRDSITEDTYNRLVAFDSSLCIQVDRADSIQWLEEYDILGYLCSKGFGSHSNVGAILDTCENNGTTLVNFGTYYYSGSTVNCWFPRG